MNPILSQFNQQNSQQNNLLSLLNVRDPKEQVMKMIDNMSPQQKVQFKNTLPQIMQFAEKQGIDTNNAFNEISARLTSKL